MAYFAMLGVFSFFYCFFFIKVFFYLLRIMEDS